MAISKVNHIGKDISYILIELIILSDLRVLITSWKLVIKLPNFSDVYIFCVKFAVVRGSYVAKMLLNFHLLLHYKYEYVQNTYEIVNVKEINDLI